MRNHYLPQHYLQGFTAASGSLCVYEKGKDGHFITQPKNVASINNLYTDQIERHLANDVENSANVVLDKIRNHQAIGHEDKVSLARYMTSMWKRVPAARQRAHQMVPLLVREHAERLDKACADLVIQEPAKAAQFESRKEEAHRVLRKISMNLPDELWQESITPERTPDLLNALVNMRWSFLVSPSGGEFLTCDNPLFFFSDLGVVSAHSEVSLPISSHIAIWGSWRTDIPEGFLAVRSKVVHEMNRRIAQNATKYIISRQSESWIASFLAKKSWRLNSLDLKCR